MKDHETTHELKLRSLNLEDCALVVELAARIYPDIENPWEEDDLQSMIEHFSEGQLCVVDKGTIVAVALTMIIDYSAFGDDHSLAQVVGSGQMEKHAPDGDYLYGVEVFVHPDYRGLRLGRRLYDARKELCENLNLKGIIVGGRIPGYAEHSDRMSPPEYLQRVKLHELYDPVLTFQLSNDFHVKRLIQDYWPDDQPSKGYSVLLEWNNILYEERAKLVGGTKSIVRLGVVQWGMRRFTSFEDFMQQAEFFIDTVSDYEADIILFPELFNAPLIHRFKAHDPIEAMRALAQYTDRLRREMIENAIAYNINIITGSVPELDENGHLYNVCFLCRRDGTWDSQYKLHVTPEELASWGLTGGDSLKVMDTDVGKVGILICYDVEFPELARLLSEEGAEILLVPLWTDTMNAYQRVRLCAQARAIENECYVAISGSVGNIPKVVNMGIQYSQAAIFTPSDFSFPHDAIAAEATPGIETALIADLDLDLLKELRATGSVCNLMSRRTDLYKLEWLKR